MTALQSLVRWASTAAAVILVASFGLFAVEQAKGGSKQEVNRLEGINQPAPSPASERERQAQHGDVREAIDDADDILVAPFSGIIDSGSIWAQRGVTTLLGLLAYFVLLRILAGYIPGRK